MIPKGGIRFSEKIMPQRQGPSVVNLRQARKRKARADSEAAAAQNRILHGRSKAEKTRDRLAAEKSQTRHEGNFRERGPDTTGDGE